MSDKFEYVITLESSNDLDSFYQDMETPGGTLYIPDRAIPVHRRRPISRNTHYLLTEEEAQLIRNDSRVVGVDRVDIILNSIVPMWTQTANFSKNTSNTNSHKNWGLLRVYEGSQRSGWGSDGASPDQTETIQVNGSGKNVDVVIIDGHINPNHPEYAVNEDGTGGSRVNQLDWFTLNSTVTGIDDDAQTLLSGSYSYTPYDGAGEEDNNHGAHVAGTVAGNTQGWARDANIYNINPYSTNPNSITALIMWDYIRAFHRTKSINPATNKRNPTICNGSYGSTIRFPNVSSASRPYNTGPITVATYNGVTVSNGGGLSSAQLTASGIYNVSAVANVPYWYASVVADIQQAIDDGIVVVGSAGNDSFYIDAVNSSGWTNNTFQATFEGINYLWYSHRGSSPGAATNVICVGAVGQTQTELKATYSNTGPRIDIYAPGNFIMSSLNSAVSFGGTTDPRNASYVIGKISGTSMASPQVCGVLACLLETYPDWTQDEILEYLQSKAKSNQLTDTGGGTADTTALQGAGNRYLFFFPERASSGAVFPKVNYSLRPVSGAVYPRRRIKF